VERGRWRSEGAERGEEEGEGGKGSHNFFVPKSMRVIFKNKSNKN